MLAAGGGSGGHVTPVVAVINEVAREDISLKVTFVCDKAFATQSQGLMKNADVTVDVRVIKAGKFRRYKHLTIVRQLLMPRIVLANFFDIFKIIAGFFQSLWLMIRDRPDIVFAKGGFVCLPVGMAAWVLRIPVVLHDSDARPGLTNRILSRWATAIATGSPLENYTYPVTRSRYVGVPIDPHFHRFTDDEKRAARRKIGVSLEKPLVVVTGGGLGSASINKSVVKNATNITKHDIQIYHVTGKAHFDGVKNAMPTVSNYYVVPFVFEGMPEVLGAADVVVSRASATFTQELAGLGQAVILIPARQLSDQRKNAEVYEKADAAVVLSDDQLAKPDVLYETIASLIKNTKRRQTIADNLYSFARLKACPSVSTNRR